MKVTKATYEQKFLNAHEKVRWLIGDANDTTDVRAIEMEPYRLDIIEHGLVRTDWKIFIFEHGAKKFL